MSTKQQRIAELAKQSPQMGFTSLNHHLDLIWLDEAYHRTRKDGAPGVDGQTGRRLRVDLQDNLESLLDRAKSGTYLGTSGAAGAYSERDGEGNPPHRDPDVGGQGPSAGGRHGAGADLRTGLSGLFVRLPAGTVGAQALEALWQQMMDMGGGWLVEVDIRKFFDTLDHAHLRKLLRQRVRDGVLAPSDRQVVEGGGSRRRGRSRTPRRERLKGA